MKNLHLSATASGLVVGLAAAFSVLWAQAVAFADDSNHAFSSIEQIDTRRLTIRQSTPRSVANLEHSAIMSGTTPSQGHYSSIYQSGESNKSSIRQRGFSNAATVGQYGHGHDASIYQNGTGLGARVEQNGNGRRVKIMQFGSGNASPIVVRQY